MPSTLAGKGKGKSAGAAGDGCELAHPLLFELFCTWGQCCEPLCLLLAGKGKGKSAGAAGEGCEFATGSSN